MNYGSTFILLTISLTTGKRKSHSNTHPQMKGLFRILSCSVLTGSVSKCTSLFMKYVPNTGHKLQFTFLLQLNHFTKSIKFAYINVPNKLCKKKRFKKQSLNTGISDMWTAQH